MVNNVFNDGDLCNYFNPRWGVFTDNENITSDFCSSSNDSEMELLKDDSIYKEEIVDAQLEHSEESVQSNLPITENEISMMSIEARFRLLINETSR